MEKYKVLDIMSGGERYFIGTAHDLALMVKEWIVEDIYMIPEENGRSFMEDGEFMDSLAIADELDTLAREESETAIYRIHYTDGEEMIAKSIEVCEFAKKED